MSKKKEQAPVEVPEKFIVKQPVYIAFCLAFAALFALGGVVMVMSYVRAQSIPSILFTVAFAYYGYCSLYLLTRAQYDVVTLWVSYKTMLIFCVLAVFIMMAPLYSFFGGLSALAAYHWLCLALAIATFGVGLWLFVSVLVMRKRAKKVMLESRKKKRR